MDAYTSLIYKLNQDRQYAHALLFKDRHKNITPIFHHQLIQDAHSDTRKLIQMAFRGGGKSSIVGEEFVIIGALLQEFRNVMIVGSSEKRAVERLRAIKHELLGNNLITNIFGNMQGPTWNEERIELSNGIVMQAVGRGQSLRGVKHLDARPDLCIADDIEDEECVATEWAREKTMIWFNNVLLPAMDPDYRIRVIGTPLHPESVLMKISKEPDWKTRTYPIQYINDSGITESSWPDRFPLDKIEEMRSSSARLGQLTQFMQEYMCVAENPETKPFKSEMIRIEPIVRTWQSVYAMLDPARTVNQKSAHTGCVVWSWINNRLVIWEAWGKFLMPDEIVQELFRINEEYHPIQLGIERDGLEQFLMQPIRQEMLKRGVGLPIEGMKAPRDKSKLDFIRGLQPFFMAREVIFTRPMPDLESQLLNFPTGRIDVPNALAYALRMRTGKPIYEDFTTQNIVEGIKPYGDSPLWLILHGNNITTTAVVAQYDKNILRILWDRVLEGDPTEVVLNLIEQASMLYKNLKLISPPVHFDDWKNIGLKQFLFKQSYTLMRGGEERNGREIIRRLLREQVHGLSAVRVGTDARWTLNAFSGGYARKVNSDLSLSLEPDDNIYRLIMESIESLMANIVRIQSIIKEDDNASNYSYTKDGKKYRSALVSQ